MTSLVRGRELFAGAAGVFALWLGGLSRLTTSALAAAPTRSAGDRKKPRELADAYRVARDVFLSGETVTDQEINARDSAYHSAADDFLSECRRLTGRDDAVGALVDGR